MIAPRVLLVRRPAGRAATVRGRQTREQMIRTAAYLLAERRGFLPGHELDDWLAAERQVDRTIASRALGRR
jgi:Protein of unknown function (DUF2934)